VGALGAYDLMVMRSRLSENDYRLVDLLGDEDYEDFGKVLRRCGQGSCHSDSVLKTVVVGRLRARLGLGWDLSARGLDIEVGEWITGKADTLFGGDLNRDVFAEAPPTAFGLF